MKIVPMCVLNTGWGKSSLSCDYTKLSLFLHYYLLIIVLFSI